MKGPVAITLWLYQQIARAFPREFRDAYADELIQVTGDAAQWVWERHGVRGLMHLLIDLVRRVVAERVDELKQDLRYGSRTISNSPVFTSVAVLSLALGIFGAASVSSTVNALILRDVPVVESPEQLIALRSTISYPLYERYQARGDLFSSSSAYLTKVPVHLSVGSVTERVDAQLVAPSYFSTLKIRPAQGDVGGERSAIVWISHRVWRDRLASDPSVIGRTLRVNGYPCVVTGVMPESFHGASPLLMSADLWLPLTSDARVVPELAGNVFQDQEHSRFAFLARLQPGVTHQQAETELDALTRQANRDFGIPQDEQKGRIVQVIPGGKLVPVRKQNLPLLLSFPLVIVGVILLIACSNVVNLMLARAAERRREVAVRLALGASRTRIIRQLVTESALIAAAAGALGILLAFWEMRLLSASSLTSYMVKAQVGPGAVDFTPDMHVVFLSVGLALLIALLIGLAPAVQVTRTSITLALKQGGPLSFGRFRRWNTRSFLVLAQITGSVALLLLTGTLVVGFRKTAGLDLGFDPARLSAVSLDPMRDGHSQHETTVFYEKLLRQIRSSNFAESASLTNAVPFGPGPAQSLSFQTDSSAIHSSRSYSVGAGYFETMNVSLMAGRTFRHDENSASVIVNESFARRYAGVGHRLRLRPDHAIAQIVGVVRDHKTEFTMETVPPALFFPLDESSSRTLLVRSVPGVSALDAITREITLLDARVHPFDLRALPDLIDEQMSVLSIAGAIHAAEGLLGLLLACIGLGGVTAYAVSRRSREIGIRIALGATRARVMRLVMRDGMMLVLVGTLLGTTAAALVTKALASSVQAVAIVTAETALTPALFLICAAGLGAVTLMACYVPARRAARIDAAVTLRQD